MLSVLFPRFKNSPLKVMILGAHSDDIEIGCGGTILRLLAEYPDTEITWIVLSANPLRAAESAKSAERLLHGIRMKKVILKGFRDGFFPYTAVEIKEFFEKLKQEGNPDLILTHYRGDLHQDHRFVSEMTYNTFREHLIVEYEIIKYDGDLGSPNLYVCLDEEVARKKISLIMDCFRSQSDKHWFTEETFWSILRIRGVEANSPGRFAEGFYCRKMVV